MNKKCVEKCISSPGITVGVGYCEFHYKIVNFHKKRSIPKEIPSEVEVSVVKMLVITRDDCIDRYFLYVSVQTITDHDGRRYRQIFPLCFSSNNY